MTDVRNRGRLGGCAGSIQTVLAGILLAGCSLAAARAAEGGGTPPGGRRPIADAAVMQAGGGCRGCRQPQCEGCRRAGQHHGRCRDGQCHPYCPVRPREFGFYGTQWRRWPGEGIVPVVNLQEATPELPPKSAVPRVDEESPEKEPEVGPAEDAAAETQGAAAAPERPVPEPLPEQERPAPLNPAVEPPPAPAPPVGDAPAAKPKPKQDDLFDESATGPVPRRFIARNAASMTRPALPTSRPAVRPATLTYPGSVEALPKSVGGTRPRVPRVPFDPAAEAARLGR